MRQSVTEGYRLEDITQRCINSLGLARPVSGARDHNLVSGCVEGIPQMLVVQRPFLSICLVDNVVDRLDERVEFLLVFDCKVWRIGLDSGVSFLVDFKAPLGGRFDVYRLRLILRNAPPLFHGAFSKLLEELVVGAPAAWISFGLAGSPGGLALAGGFVEIRLVTLEAHRLVLQVVEPVDQIGLVRPDALKVSLISSRHTAAGR